MSSIPILPINMYHLHESNDNNADGGTTQQQLMGYGHYLAEKRWPSWVGDVDNTYMQRLCAILLENQLQYQNLMRHYNHNTLFHENTTTAGISTFSQSAFQVVRGLIPNLVAADLVSVQPMTGPTSLVFYLKIVAGSNKGRTSVGDELTETMDENYSSELVEGETELINVGSTAAQTFNLDYFPVRRGTLTITLEDSDTTHNITDDGNGNLVASSSVNLESSGNTINYETGAVSIDFSAAPAGLSGTITADISYRYNMEQNDRIPEIDVSVTSAPVVARERKLRARYGFEAAANLSAVHGIDMGDNISNWATQELRHEIDREVIKSVRNVASAGRTEDFNRTPSDGLGVDEHLRGFKQTLNDGGNLIFSATKRAQGNWIVGGVDVGSIIEMLPGFQPSGMNDQHGVVNIGTVDGRWNCFKDPYGTTTERGDYMVGHKGSDFMETGYILAFYIPLYTTPEITLDDFINRRGMATLYAKRSVDGRYYSLGRVTKT